MFGSLTSERPGVGDARSSSSSSSVAPAGRRDDVAWVVAAGFAAALVFCCWREPLAFDGWGHYLYREQVPATWREVWRQVVDSYLYGNPRLGQAITVLLYLDWLHRIGTPAVVIFVVLACCYLVQGRWPRLRRGEDWGLVALVTALLLVLVGNVGMMFFYRPYAGNYVYGFAFYLALLLPYRRALGRGRTATGRWGATGRALAMLVLGLAAGLTNEHTGAAVLAGLVGGAAWQRWQARKSSVGAALAPWMIAGVVGLAVGYAALILAPGQLVRYGGLGREPWTRWVLERGWDNVTLWMIGLAPLTPALTLAVVLRCAPAPGIRRAVVGFCVVVSLLICATLLLSPKVGLRLFWPVTVMQVIATATWLGPSLLAPRLRRWTLAVCTLVIVGHAGLFSQAYAERATEQADRLRRLREASPGAQVALPCYRPRSMHSLVADDVAWPSTQRNWQAAFGVSVRADGAHCPRRAAPGR